MKQKDVQALLLEAADPKTSWQRRNQIQCELGQASPAMGPDGVYEIEGREAGMHLILSALYVDTLRHRPDLLPSLFPVFALICGDREDDIIRAEIDWSLM